MMLSLTLRRRDGRAANGFRGGFFGWGGGALRGRFADSAFGRLDCWLAETASGALREEDVMVGPGWSLTACGFSSSESEDDPYATIPGGRLADITSGAALSSSSSPLSSPSLSSEPRCDAASASAPLADSALGTLGGRGSSVSFTAGDLDNGRVGAENVMPSRVALLSCTRFRLYAPRPRPRPRPRLPPNPKGVPPLPRLVLVTSASDDRGLKRLPPINAR